MNLECNPLPFVASMIILLGIGQTRAQSPTPTYRLVKSDQPPIVEQTTEGESAAAPVQSKPGGDLPKAVISYASHLRDLAKQAQLIEARLPQTPQEGVTNLWQFKALLTRTRDVLIDILKSKEEITAERERVLESASRVQQSFLNVAKKISADAEEHRRRMNGQPSAIQAVIQGQNSAKTAAENGAALVAMLRDQVVKDSNDVESTLTELTEYRTLFDNLIEVCRLYIAGLGDMSEYSEMVQALAQAREALRQVVQSFAAAAMNAEKAAKKIPATPPLSGTLRPSKIVREVL
jgi:hypothetical protein